MLGSGCRSSEGDAQEALMPHRTCPTHGLGPAAAGATGGDPRQARGHRRDRGRHRSQHRVRMAAPLPRLGRAGLLERSSRPHHSPRSLPRAAVETILAARVGTGDGPHRLAYLTGYPRSTIGDVLRRRDDVADWSSCPVIRVGARPLSRLAATFAAPEACPARGGLRLASGYPPTRPRPDHPARSAPPQAHHSAQRP